MVTLLVSYVEVIRSVANFTAVLLTTRQLQGKLGMFKPVVTFFEANTLLWSAKHANLIFIGTKSAFLQAAK